MVSQEEVDQDVADEVNEGVEWVCRPGNKLSPAHLLEW